MKRLNEGSVRGRVAVSPHRPKLHHREAVSKSTDPVAPIEDRSTGFEQDGDRHGREDREESNQEHGCDHRIHRALRGRICEVAPAYLGEQLREDPDGLGRGWCIDRRGDDHSFGGHGDHVSGAELSLLWGMRDRRSAYTRE